MSTQELKLQIKSLGGQLGSIAISMSTATNTESRAYKAQIMEIGEKLIGLTRHIDDCAKLKEEISILTDQLDYAIKRADKLEYRLHSLKAKTPIEKANLKKEREQEYYLRMKDKKIKRR